MGTDMAKPVVGVIGLGTAGLYQAAEFLAHGHQVVGHDTSASRIAAISAGRAGLPDLPDDTVAAHLAAGELAVSNEPSCIATADSVLVSVPTDTGPDGTPDIGPVAAAVRTIAAHCRRGVLVVVKSTAYPGMVRSVVEPVLHDAFGAVETGGFALAYAPERGDPGNRNLAATAAIPKVVAGLTFSCAERAAALYRPFGGPVHVASSVESAELVKLHENVFRFLNIGYVNELAELCSRIGVDVDEVVALAATKPFGFMPFTAGVGVGGMYVPVNPAYLLAGARLAGIAVKTVEAAFEVNTTMPQTIVDRLERTLGDLAGRKVLVLGVTYKSGSGDLRRSPAAAVAAELAQISAVTAADPYAAGATLPGTNLTICDPVELDPSPFDVAVCLVAHPQLVDYIADLPVPCYNAHGRRLDHAARTEPLT